MKKSLVYFLFITPKKKKERDTIINLILISRHEKTHYCLIKDFDRLMFSRTKHHGRMHHCMNCLHGFSRADLLEKHKEVCLKNQAQTLTFPDEENQTVYFKSYIKQQRSPFVIYADFECYTAKNDGTKYQHHIPNSFSYVVVSTEARFSRPPVTYRGDNAVQVFLDKIMEEDKRIRDILNKPQPLKMTLEDERLFQHETECHICGKPLNEDKVRDHCHLSGVYRGAAHNKCNLNYRLMKKNQRDEDTFVIPVIFHNLRGYDSHLIMESVGKYKDKKISVIPNTLEKYISFTLDNLRFIDSLQFMNALLEKLVKNLAHEGKDRFTIMTKHIPSPQEQDLLLRKGVYPYDYVDTPAKLQEQQLPRQEDFYSLLTEQHISDEDYTHAQKVWETFNCQTLGDYHDLYLKSDVLLLADVFENFRDVCMDNYKLDPAHYYTAPGLAWDAMLRLTGVELDLITDIDMYQMVEQGIRGGISMISNKYAKANNPYVPEYDEDTPHSYIMYLDANNLYGWAMSQSLPRGSFEWVEDVDSLNVMTIPDDGDKGYILEVDLEYPDHIHDQHSDYPLAPERKTIPIHELSPYSQELREELGMKGKPSKKLVPNLNHKTKYVIHYRNLKLYLSLGMKLTKIHRAISFTQSKWLATYIDFNTQKRKEAKNAFEKDFYKLMNNAVFGKTMENVRKRIRVELVHVEKRFRKVVSKPSFHRFKIFNEDLTGVHLRQVDLELNKPIYVGLCILELSKILMYGFHYNYIKQKYPDAKLLFTDTDSLCYHIHTEDIYKDMHQDAAYFDTSDYPTSHFLHSNTNKKVLGKMKDETAGIPIEEFVGLRPKMYSLLYRGEEKKTAKGIGRTHIRKMRHMDYKKALFDRVKSIATVNHIRSYAHDIYSERVTKVALSPFDDKRYVLNDGISTLAHGHFGVDMIEDFDMY